MLPRSARTALIIAASAIGLATLSSCDEPRATRGRVEGIVRAAPTCPVEQQGQVCPPRAVEGEVQAERDGEVVEAVRTSPNGAYELALDAGDYLLVVDVGAPLPSCPPTPVQVRVAATVVVDITCDTGIR